METRRKHRQSCKECKAKWYEFLADCFGRGEVVHQYSLGLSSTIQGWEKHPYFSTLAVIESELKAFRGFRCLVSRKRLPPVDFFVKSVRLIVEFDETQHFTKPREIALERYPGTLTLGFSRGRWLRLCTKLNRHDNSPRYRDEQRAWLDTLRDFAPALLGFQPVVRIYAGDAVWCRLDRREWTEAMQRCAPQLAQTSRAG